MSSGHIMHIEPEPISVGADTAARMLRSIGWVNSADLVEKMGNDNARQYREMQDWKRLYYEALQKLHPPAPREKPHDPQPPPEASD